MAGAGVTTGSGVAAGEAVVPTGGITVDPAVGTAFVPITAMREQIDDSVIGMGFAEREFAMFVASRNIWPQLGLAQT